jgi:hypothetical protein
MLLKKIKVNKLSKGRIYEDAVEFPDPQKKRPILKVAIQNLEN